MTLQGSQCQVVFNRQLGIGYCFRENVLVANA